MFIKSCLKLLPVFVTGVILAAAITTECSQIPGRLASPGTPAAVLSRGPIIQQPDSIHTLFANPSAVYCKDLGYPYKEVDDGAGGVKGVCVMPDNTSCDSWDFIAGKCGAKFSYCAQHGYDQRVATDGQNPFSSQYAVCVDKKGQDVGSATSLDGLVEKVKTSKCTNDNPLMQGVQSSSSSSPKTLTADANVQGLANLVGSPPASLDWRNATYAGKTGNWLTPVKDQGSCGSCWAFGAVGQTEAVLKMAADDPTWNPNLAEEYLVSDCTSAGTCCGGWHASALDFIQNSGIPDEACMPYVSGSCSCGSTCSCKYNSSGSCANSTCSNRCSNYASRLSKITEYGYVGTDPTTIKQALVTYGPLSVAFDVSDAHFDTNRVMKCTNPSQVDHAVDLVGYNDAGGYWIARNSWGSGWNGDGYFKIGYGQCLIEDYVFYADAPSVLSGTVRNGSGTGLGGVTMSGLPDTPTTDSNGNYSDTVPYNWSGTVTPSKAGYTFSPVNSSYPNVLVNQAGQDYTATVITYTVSGSSGVAGATLSYTDGTPKTVVADGSGNYSFVVSYGWSGTVTPFKIGYSFTPTHDPYTNVLANQTNQNYTATAVATFADVPTTYWAWSFIERLYSAGITGGCGTSPLIYCPDSPVTRAQIAIFLERGMNGSTYTPSAGTGTVFGDVPISYWADSWIEKLYADGITGGCGTSPLIYCPNTAVTRATMATLLLRAEHGSSYIPPAATGTVFGDVPISYWAAAWIEKLYAEGITGGCGGGNYCPDNPVTRAQMAIFLVRTFNLP